MRTIILSLLLGLAILPARADDLPTTRSNAIAILAKPALPPDFPYFPYVNPNAPKGGEVTLASIGTFDSFNPFILRGTSASGMVSPWVILRWRLRLWRHRRACVGKSAHLVRRRGRDRLRPSRRDHRAAGQQAVGGVRAAAGGEVLRRHAGHRRGRRLDLPHAAGARAAELPHPDGRREGRGGGKSAARGVPLQVEREPRAAADPGRHAGAA